MSKPSCLVIALLLAVFTVDQVVLSYAMDTDDRSELCDPLEKEAGNTAETFELKMKEVNGNGLLVAAFIELRDTGNLGPVCDLMPEGLAPHGNHVPIYLDERVLRI